MAQENNFLNKLNQQYGLPKDIAIDTIMNSKGGNILEAGGMAICARQFPEIPVYAGLAGAGAGILVTLLGVFIYNTLFRRRKHNIVVVNNSTPPVA